MATRPPPPPNSDNWKSNYFAIFEHPPSCICVAVCPCLLVGRLVELLDASITSCCVGGCIYCCVLTCTGGIGGWLYTCNYRSRLRAKYGLPEEPCCDCLADALCPCLSITQMYREFVRRGIDPSLGYISNRHRLDPPLEVKADPAAPSSPGHGPVFVTYQQGYTPPQQQQQPATYAFAPPPQQQPATYDYGNAAPQYAPQHHYQHPSPPPVYVSAPPAAFAPPHQNMYK